VARATAAKNKITELETKKLDAEEQINKINKTVEAQKKKTTNDEFKVVGMAATTVGKTAAQKNLELENNKTRALKEQYEIIKNINAEQAFYEKFAGETNLQKVTTPPPPPPPPETSGTKTPKGKKENPFDRLSFDAKMRFQQQAEMSDKFIAPPSGFGKDSKNEEPKKGGIGDPSYWIGLATAREKLNEQMAAANELAAMGGQAFGQLAMAMLNGQNLGEVFSEMLKKLVAQLVAAVAQAAILSLLIRSIPGLSEGFAAMGAINGGMNSAGGLIGMIQGNNIQLSQSRTSTGMGYRRGRR